MQYWSWLHPPKPWQQLLANNLRSCSTINYKLIHFLKPNQFVPLASYDITKIVCSLFNNYTYTSYTISIVGQYLQATTFKLPDLTICFSGPEAKISFVELNQINQASYKKHQRHSVSFLRAHPNYFGILMSLWRYLFSPFLPPPPPLIANVMTGTLLFEGSLQNFWLNLHNTINNLHHSQRLIKIFLSKFFFFDNSTLTPWSSSPP